MVSPVAEKSFSLESDECDIPWPKTIQSVQYEKLRDHFDRELKPFIVVMSHKQQESYIIRDRYKSNEKLKHYMYAGQWFIFSLIGLYLCIFLIRSTFWIKEK